ncbi:MAG: hypothetical protein LKI24_09765 [Acidipropionibacterium sp.]|jgi:hypothetical protein|nr:hypothetical protein [Acidipropionibacterium sp.]
MAVPTKAANEARRAMCGSVWMPPSPVLDVLLMVVDITILRFLRSVEIADGSG